MRSGGRCTIYQRPRVNSSLEASKVVKEIVSRKQLSLAECDRARGSERDRKEGENRK